MPLDKTIVPALMFHSVGLQHHPWAWSYISESLEDFEGKIACLSRAGYQGIFWSDLYEYMAGRKSLTENSILLTFDDGYLDNWVYVFPILKRYGMKGTIFVSPDFVDPGADLRPNLEDVQKGRCSTAELQIPGFLSWAEMRAMESAGIIDIQSHAMTHTWYFTGPKVVDFHRPHDVTPYPWLLWNAVPNRKPYYLNEDQQGFLPWGSPIFENRKSLAARRFFPDEAVVVELTEYVEKRGGQEYFQQPNWRNQLERWLRDRCGSLEVPGRTESESDRLSRIEAELRDSKALIESNLSKEVDFICWPGGANDQVVQRVASEVGYKSWTLDSRSQLDKRNMRNVDPTSIKRMGTSSRVDVKGRDCGMAAPRYLLWRVQQHQGSQRADVVVKAYKSIKLARSILGVRT